MGNVIRKTQSGTQPEPSEKKTDWLRLCLKTPLPVLPATAQRLYKQLADKHIAMSALASTIYQDPVAILSVLRSINAFAQHHNRSLPVTTMTHNLSLMGYTQSRSMLSSLSPIDSSTDTLSYYCYDNALQRSLHAGFQARAFAQTRVPHLSETVFLATIVMNTPEWVLWCAAPSHMRMIIHLQYNKGLSPYRAQMAVLGVSLPTLAAKMLAQWQFPESIRLCVNTLSFSQIRTLTKATRLYHNGARTACQRMLALDGDSFEAQSLCHLANQLSYAADINWHSRQTRRMIQAIAAVTNESTEHTQAWVRSNAFAASATQQFAGITSPGLRLMQHSGLPTAQQQQPKKIPEYVEQLMEQKEHLSQERTLTGSLMETINTWISELSQADKRAMQPKSLSDPNVYYRLFNRLQTGSKDLDTKGILTLAVYCLEAIGLTTVTVLLLNRQAQSLNRLPVTQSPDSTFSGQSWPLNASILFQKLLEKPLAIHCEDALKQNNLIRLLPPEFQKSGAQEGHFFLSSIFSGQVPLGIVYAHAKPASISTEKHHYHLFKTVLRLASLCIGQQDKKA